MRPKCVLIFRYFALLCCLNRCFISCLSAQNLYSARINLCGFLYFVFSIIYTICDVSLFFCPKCSSVLSFPFSLQLSNAQTHVMYWLLHSALAPSHTHTDGVSLLRIGMCAYIGVCVGGMYAGRVYACAVNCVANDTILSKRTVSHGNTSRKQLRSNMEHTVYVSRRRCHFPHNYKQTHMSACACVCVDWCVLTFQLCCIHSMLKEKKNVYALYTKNRMIALFTMF